MHTSYPDRGSTPGPQLLVALLLMTTLMALLAFPLAARAQGCQDDGYEENDTAAQAPLLQPGTYADLVICSGDEDWFRVEFPANTRVTVSITFTHAQGDLDLYLMDETGLRALESATSQTDNETLTYVATTDTRAYIRVAGYQGAANTYTLTYTTEAYDDRFEENDSIAQAPLLQPGTYPDLIITPNDADYFAVDMPARSVLQATIFFTHAQGDLDLYLTTETRTLRSSTSSNDNEQVLYATDVAQRVYLYVEGYRGASNTYTLVLQVEEQGQCPEDAFAPNHTREEAAPLPPGEYGLTLCPQTEDWFRPDVSGPGTLLVRLTFRYMLGDLDLRLWDGDTVLASSLNSRTDEEVITYVFDAAAQPRLHVFAAYTLSLGVPYTLTYIFATPTPTPTPTPTFTPTPTPTATPTSTPTPTVTPTSTSTPTPTPSPTPTSTPTPTPWHLYLPSLRR